MFDANPFILRIFPFIQSTFINHSNIYPVREHFLKKSIWKTKEEHSTNEFEFTPFYDFFTIPAAFGKSLESVLERKKNPDEDSNLKGVKFWLNQVIEPQKLKYPILKSIFIVPEPYHEACDNM